MAEGGVTCPWAARYVSETGKNALIWRQSHREVVRTAGQRVYAVRRQNRGANATLATIPEGKRCQPIACMDGWPRPVRAPGVRPGRIEQRAAILGAGAGDGYIAASPTPAAMA